jgi:hypothetical protein
MATEYQVQLLQECATQAAHHQDLSDECQDALAAMPSSPPRDVDGGIPVGDMVVGGFFALCLILVAVGWVIGKIERLLVRLKLKRPRPSFWEKHGIKPPDMPKRS